LPPDRIERRRNMGGGMMKLELVELLEQRRKFVVNGL
jgi:hypothetical protein